MNRIKRDINYIYWLKESTLQHLSQEQFSEKVLELEDSGYKRVKYSCRRDIYLFDKKYSVRKIGDYFNLYFIENETLQRYSTNWFDNNKVDPKGRRAIVLVNKDFISRTGKTMCKAFGTVEEEFKRCIPKQLTYINEKLKDKKILASSIDGCSQYPAHACGSLPDAHTAVRHRGTIKPNEEYPFAFYLKSGHIAEYGVFDTHDWYTKWCCGFNVEFGKQLFRFDKKTQWSFNGNIDPNEDITVLMKRSGESMSDTFNHFYQLKEQCKDGSSEREDAKLVMNGTIGMWHKQNYKDYKYAHLAAIAIARANNNILNKIAEIGLNYIAQVCVDGIIYLGDKKHGSDNKALGEYHQEFAGCIGKISATNRYIFMRDGEIVKVKTQGVNRNLDGTPINKETITSIDDQYQWIKVDPLEELKRYEEKVQEE